MRAQRRDPRRATACRARRTRAFLPLARLPQRPRSVCRCAGEGAGLRHQHPHPDPLPMGEGSKASTARGNDRRGGARPLFLFLSPAGGGDRGAALSGAQAESKEKRGHTQRLEVAPASPLTLPSPPKGRGKEERASRTGVTEAEAPRAGMTAGTATKRKRCNYIMQDSVGEMGLLWLQPMTVAREPTFPKLK